MTETGRITEVGGRTATVRLDGGPPGGCGGCRACAMGRDGARIVEGLNEAGARPGDRVRVEIPDGALLKVSALLYGVPLAGFLAGALAAAALPPGPLRAVALPAVFLPAWFAGTRLADRYARSHGPRVVGAVAETDGIPAGPTTGSRDGSEGEG